MREFWSELHAHTDYSNLTLVDCINKVENLIQYAFDLGLHGLAITDHEALCGHIKARDFIESKRKSSDEELAKKWKDFKLILGNEIYLCRNGLSESNFISGQDKFYHFILLAKDEIGHSQLQELSSLAWERSWMKFIRRRPTYYSDIEKIVGNNPGHIIASTACIGGFLGTTILKYGADSKNKSKYQQGIIDFLNWCVNIFGEENFFLEMQPSNEEEQVFVNTEIQKISAAMGIPVIITTDAHYLKKEDRKIHKAYLNSKDGDREVDSFYASTYVMTAEEIHEYMDDTVGASSVSEYLSNTNLIADMCEDYSLEKPIVVPYIPLNDYEYLIKDRNYNISEYYSNIPSLKLFAESPYISDNHLAFRIVDAINSNKFYTQDDKVKDRLERIEVELNTLWTSSEKQDIRWSAYLLQESDYVKIFWEDSLVGPGRGSGVSFYLNYLLDICQIDPTREKAPMRYWRFINPERASILDIDVDIEGNKRNRIIEHMQEVYGKEHVTRVCTFGTEKARRAIATACRGLGIDVDIAQYLGSMVASERGIQRTLSETFYGDEEKGIAPNKQFVIEMTDNYPEVWNVAQRIEGLVCSVGIHAGGVIITDKPIQKSCAIMRTQKGDIVSQYELHDAEKAGLIKIDLLAVEALDKERACIDLLCKYNYAEKKDTLRETYENIIGVYKIERDNPDMWKMIWENKIFSIFQMDQASGVQGIALTKPKSVEDLATLNSVIRLMASEKGAEQPLNKYARFRSNPDDWEKEMNEYGLNEDEKKLIRKHLTLSCGICESQEAMMSLLLEPEVAGWSLAQVDKTRKAVAKKKPKEFKELTEQFFENAKEKNLSKNLTDYVWNVLVKTQKGYSFNLSHTLAYSIIGLQEMNLAFNYPIIFWNCANMIVDSGATDSIADEDEDDEKGIVILDSDDEDEDEDDVVVATQKKAENKTVDYEKISLAIGKMRKHGISVSLPDINMSDYSFTPNVESNTIIYGIKGITRIGDSLVKEIIMNRPYMSINDFMSKVKVNKTQIVNLIKSGCFDRVEGKTREEILYDYTVSISDTKSRLTLQNMPSLIREDLIPDEMKEYEKLYNFNKYLKQYKSGIYYILDSDARDFYCNRFDTNQIKEIESGETGIIQTVWDKIYKKAMEPMRDYLKDPKNHMLDIVNSRAISVMKDKYAKGNISKWEMQSVGFYSHEHELQKYYNDGYFNSYPLTSFSMLPEDPVVDKMVFNKKSGQSIPLFKLSFIAGTVIGKNKNKHIVALLTDSGVVNVKIWDAQFTKYDKQISVKLDTGKKKIIERSWFSRGNKLLLCGIRRGDNFIPKIYKNGCGLSSPIILIDDDMNLVYSRADEEE